MGIGRRPPIKDKEDGDGEQEHEPEPEEQVDLLVDDVLQDQVRRVPDEAQEGEYLGEDTEAVVSLLVPCCSHIGDVAGHFCGEDGTEGVPWGFSW